jgi:hypothetical protein
MKVKLMRYSSDLICEQEVAKMILTGWKVIGFTYQSDERNYHVLFQEVK